MSDQITKCQQTPRYRGHTMSFIASDEYHNRRHTAGDRQVWCKRCQRWKYRERRTIDGFGCDGDALCSEGTP